VIERVKSLGAEGKLSGQQLADALEQAKRKADELIPGIQSVEEAYKTLGITSQAEMQKTADSAKAAYEQIKAGGASLTDQAAAWKAYAEKAIAANGGVASSMIQAQAPENSGGRYRQSRRASRA